MRILTKLFAAMLVCAFAAFAQTNTVAKPAASTPVVKTKVDKQVKTTGVQPKTPTNWTKVKDLFM